MSDILRIFSLYANVIFDEKKTVTECPPILSYILGWPKWKVIDLCAAKGWDHGVVIPTPEIIQNMNKILPDPFPIKLDPKRVRLTTKELYKILDAIVDKPKDYPVIHQSELLGAVECRYLHITIQAGSKSCYLAFGVRLGSITNCWACVNSAGKEWNIDGDDDINTWPLEQWQKLTALLLPEDKGQRRILAVPHWKVCIEMTPGKEDWVGFGNMYDTGPTKSGIQYPATLYAGVVFEKEEDAIKASNAANKYYQEKSKEKDKKKKH